jgi:hypothetical protein
MSLHILKRRTKELELSLPGGTIYGGKISAVEVRDSKTDGLVRRIKYGDKAPNMIFRKVIDDITQNTSNVFFLANSFSNSCLGLSNDANDISRNEIRTPSGLSSTIVRFNATSEDFNCREYREYSPATLETDSGDYRLYYKISHRHPILGDNATPMQIREVGYSTVATTTNNLSARIVLPGEGITLLATQYLVTTYEFEWRLPSRAVASFADIGISGLGMSANSGRVKYLGLIPDLTGSTSDFRFNRITDTMFTEERSLTISALPNVPITIASSGAINSSLTSRLAANSRTDWRPSTAGFTETSLSTGSTSIDTGDSTFRTMFLPTNSRLQSSDQINRVAWNIPRDSNPESITRDMTIENGGFIRSLYVFGYQFILDEGFELYSDQAIDITAALNWSLIQPLGS